MSQSKEVQLSIIEEISGKDPHKMAVLLQAHNWLWQFASVDIPLEEKKDCNERLVELIEKNDWLEERQIVEQSGKISFLSPLQRLRSDIEKSKSPALPIQPSVSRRRVRRRRDRRSVGGNAALDNHVSSVI